MALERDQDQFCNRRDFVAGLAAESCLPGKFRPRSETGQAAADGSCRGRRLGRKSRDEIQAVAELVLVSFQRHSAPPDFGARPVGRMMTAHSPSRDGVATLHPRPAALRALPCRETAAFPRAAPCQRAARGSRTWFRQLRSSARWRPRSTGSAKHRLPFASRAAASLTDAGSSSSNLAHDLNSFRPFPGRGSGSEPLPRPSRSHAHS